MIRSLRYEPQAAAARDGAMQWLVQTIAQTMRPRFEMRDMFALRLLYMAGVSPASGVMRKRVSNIDA